MMAEDFDVIRHAFSKKIREFINIFSAVHEYKRFSDIIELGHAV